MKDTSYTLIPVDKDQHTLDKAVYKTEKGNYADACTSASAPVVVRDNETFPLPHDGYERVTSTANHGLLTYIATEDTTLSGDDIMPLCEAWS